MSDQDSVKRSIEKIETTIGELIEAITQISQEAGHTEEESYRLASATIESILRRQAAEKNKFLLN